MRIMSFFAKVLLDEYLAGNQSMSDQELLKTLTDVYPEWNNLKIIKEFERIKREKQ